MSHHRPRLEDAFLTRRELLSRCGMGFASLGLSTLMADQASGASLSGSPLAPRKRFNSITLCALDWAQPLNPARMASQPLPPVLVPVNRPV